MLDAISQANTRHLLNRAGFGPSIHDWGKWKDLNKEEAVSRLFKLSSKASPIGNLEAPFNRGARRMMDEEAKKQFIEQNQENIKKLNFQWISQMAADQAQLREKMTFFWHDHFACRVPRAYVIQKQNNTLRKYALGKFGALLLAITQDPGMLLFLNNQQNRKSHPNENFARELLELFTLGRGHYSEQDIKEAARAFTGWATDRQGNFIFRRRMHDFGSKTFMGKTGNFDGEDIIQIVLENPRTARFITEKLYYFLVGPNPPEEILDSWSRKFYESDYNISVLLNTIFRSEHFYANEQRGSLIKSPVEYLISIIRLLGVSFDQPEAPIFVQRVLGQTLFLPPSVDGWPSGKAWIDSSSLITRLQFPKALIYSTELRVNARADFAGNEDLIKNRALSKRIQASIDWSTIQKAISKKSEAEAINELKSYFLSVPLRYIGDKELHQFTKAPSDEARMKKFCARIICTPEFQMC